MSSIDTLLILARQMEKFSSQYVAVNGERVTNPLNLSLVRRLRECGISMAQRRYLMQIASETAQSDVVDTTYEGYWRLFRDVIKKRLFNMYAGAGAIREAETSSLFDLVVFGRITSANYRVLAGLPAPQRSFNPADTDEIQPFDEFDVLLDYFEGRILPQLEEALAQIMDTDRPIIAARVERRIAEITVRVHAGDLSDLAGLEIIGPIDAAQYAALAPAARHEPAFA